MLKDATGFNHIYLATGYTDMRKGIDGMLMVIKGEFGINPLLLDIQPVVFGTISQNEIMAFSNTGRCKMSFSGHKVSSKHLLLRGYQHIDEISIDFIEFFGL